MIEFTVDVQGRDSVMSMLSGLRSQVPFATSVAINRTTEEVLAEGRREIIAGFHIRVPRFDLPPTQLPKAWRATPNRLIGYVDLGDDDGGKAGIGARRRQIFTKFEYGEPKTAGDPDFPIAIPTRVIRPNAMALVPRALYPANLRLAPRTDVDGSTLPALRKGKVRTLSGKTLGKKARAAANLQGIGGTFTMTGADGRVLGVFQRTGRGHGAFKMIWAYRQRINIPRRLDFAKKGAAIIEERFGINFDGAIELAIRTLK